MFLITCFLLALALASPAITRACSYGHVPLEERVELYDAVFEGRVLEVRQLDVRIGFFGWAAIETTFEDLRSWRGPAWVEIRVLSYPNNGANCGVSFSQGETYVMFTAVEEPFEPFDELGYEKVFYTDATFQSFRVDALAELLWMPYLDTLDRQVSGGASSWSTLKSLYDRRF